AASCSSLQSSTPPWPSSEHGRAEHHHISARAAMTAGLTPAGSRTGFLTGRRTGFLIVSSLLPRRSKGMTRHAAASSPGLGGSACRPGLRLEHERRLGEELAAPFAQRVATVRIEARDEGAGRADAERVGLPPVVERRVLDADRQRGVLDVA